MPFNKNITGYENEEEFASYLNGKTFGRVNPIFQDLLLAIYGRIDFSDTISCFVSYSKRKADIYVKVNGEVRGISIKKGVKNSVHVESLDQFCDFLHENGVSKKLSKRFAIIIMEMVLLMGLAKKDFVLANIKLDARVY